jgi:hypothetical protein
MVETDPTNVTALRPQRAKTSTERVKRFRQRKRARRALVSSSVAPVAVPETSVAIHHETPAPAPERTRLPGVTVATFVAALALATCSAAFSVSGLTAIFAGAFWPVVGMGVALA